MHCMVYVHMYVRICVYNKLHNVNVAYYRHLKRRINCLEGISPNPLDYLCPACSKVQLLPNTYTYNNYIG